MFCLNPIPAAHFDTLINKSAALRAVMKNRGELKPLIMPRPRQHGDSAWRDQTFLAADAIVIVAIDLLVKAGAYRPAVNHAMEAIQLEIIQNLTKLDDGHNVELSFGYEIVPTEGEKRDTIKLGRFWGAICADNMLQAVRATVDYFTLKGIDDANRLAFFCIPLREAYELVRARANKAKPKIPLPERMWLTLEELDAGATALATLIGPHRKSPVIEQWQRKRADEKGAKHHE